MIGFMERWEELNPKQTMTKIENQQVMNILEIYGEQQKQLRNQKEFLISLGRM